MLLRNGAEANSKGQDGTTPLMWACERGQVGVVRTLVQHVGVQGLEERCEQGWTALRYAASRGHEEVVAVLLKSGAQANSRTQDGTTPLMVACETRDADVAKLLIQHTGGQGLEERDEQGATALHHAARRGHQDIVILLLSEGALADSKDHGGKTPFATACEVGHIVAARVLLQHVGAQGLEDTTNVGYTALHCAASRGHAEVVTLLLGHGAQANSKAQGGTTPLMLASAGGTVAVVEMLLHHVRGQGLQETDDNGWIALHHAAAKGHEEVVTLLLRAGANANSKDQAGCTPLMYAARRGHAGTIQKLGVYMKGEGLEEKGASGHAALHEAACNGHEDAVAVLLSMGAEANIKAQDGTRPLMLACFKGHVGVARMLLQHMGGRGLEETQQSGLTALHLAAHAGHEKAVALLLGCGARADVQAADGSTPLICAYGGGHVGVMKLLLGHNGPIGLQVTITGRTVLHAACWKGCAEELVRAFLLAGANTAIRDNDGATPIALAEAQGHTQLVAVFNVSIQHLCQHAPNEWIW
jgi:serine/threonine-protein phosphatase 6 regulatory ankyrin repeat subunit B